MHPGGVRSAMDLFDFEKSANMKHPSVPVSNGQNVTLAICTDKLLSVYCICNTNHCTLCCASLLSFDKDRLKRRYT